MVLQLVHGLPYGACEAEADRGCVPMGLSEPRPAPTAALQRQQLRLERLELPQLLLQRFQLPHALL